MAVRFRLPSDSLLNDNANPLAGGTLTFCATGTSTPLATYSDDGLVTANSNPITLDAAGRHGDIFLQALGYKVIVKDASGTTIKTMDPVAGGIPLDAIVGAGTAAAADTTDFAPSTSASVWRSSAFSLVADDATADQHDSLLAAITAAAASTNPRDRELVISGLTSTSDLVKIGSAIALNAIPGIDRGLRIIFDGQGALVPGTNSQTLFNINDGVTAPASLIALTADGVAGSERIATTTTTFARGNVVQIQSEVVIPDALNSGGGNSSTPLKRAFIAKVLAKDSTYLYLDRTLPYDFLTSDTAKVGIVSSIGNLTFENFGWGNAAWGLKDTGRFLSATYAHNLRILSPRIQGGRTDLTTSGDDSGNDVGIALNAAIDTIIRDPDIQLMKYYGIDFNGPCNNNEVRGGVLSHNRHGIDTNWGGTGGYGASDDLRLYDTLITGSSLSNIRHHDATRRTYHSRIRCIGSLGDKGIIVGALDELVDVVCNYNAFDGVNSIGGNPTLKITGGQYIGNARYGLNLASNADVIGGRIEKNAAGGASMVGGRVIGARIDDNTSVAFIYGPNTAGLTLSPLLVEGCEITKTTNQTRIIYQYDKSGYDTSGLTFRNNKCVGFDLTSGVVWIGKGDIATTPAPSEGTHTGNQFTDEASGNKSRGTVTLDAGSGTVSTTAVFVAASATGGAIAIAGFHSRIHLQLRTAAGTPGMVRVSAITNKTSFVVTSSSSTDTSTYDWWIEN